MEGAAASQDVPSDMEQDEDPATSALIDETQALLDKFMRDPNDAAEASDALAKAAALFEREEHVFRQTCSDAFSRDREKFPIWEMLELVVRHDATLSSVFAALEQRRDSVLQAAAARFLVAAAPGLAILPSLQQSLFMELLTQDSMESTLFAMVETGRLPMCAFAEGLLALALLDDQYADEAVRRNVVPLLLRRLRGLVFEDESVLGAPGATACMHACVRACFLLSLFLLLSPRPACMLACVRAWLVVCIPTCMHACIHASMHTSMLA